MNFIGLDFYSKPLKSISLLFVYVFIFYFFLIGFLVGFVLPVMKWYYMPTIEKALQIADDVEQQYACDTCPEPPFNTTPLRERIENPEEFRKLEEKYMQAGEELQSYLDKRPSIDEGKVKQKWKRYKRYSDEFIREYNDLPEAKLEKFSQFALHGWMLAAMGNFEKLKKIEQRKKEFAESLDEKYLKHRAIRESVQDALNRE